MLLKVMDDGQRVDVPINEGEILISQASVRLDGASQHFAPLSYPAVSDFYATQAMVEACKNLNIE
ncbi:hypothetical protein COB52_05355, partial [Candidatus Kaiserbacteria bacterium]